jgi:hypothetical protein
MKPQKKSSKQTLIDKQKLADSSAHMSSIAQDFLNHFFEMDGDVSFSELMKLRDIVWSNDHARKVAKMPMVGDTWSFPKGVTGIHYYD